MYGRRSAVAFLVGVVLLSAPTAEAAVTIGESLGTIGNASTPEGTLVQASTGPGQPSYAVPAGGGVVTAWSVDLTAEAGFRVELKLFRPDGSGGYTTVGSDGRTIAAATSGGVSFAGARIPVLAGDLIGFRHQSDGPADAGAFLTSGQGTGSVTRFETDADPEPPDPFNPTISDAGFRLRVSAVVEPDADGDGYGDETQDLCPTDPTTQGSCPISALCPPIPASCRTPIASGRSSLTMRDRSPDTGDRIVWKWTKGPVTPKADFGSPTTSDDYALCIYDAGAPIASAAADGGELCVDGPCWTEGATTFTYRNRSGSSTGTNTVRLKEGLLDGRAAITFQGKGANLVLPALAAIAGPVTAQLHRSGGGACFGATYSAPFKKSDASIFSDRAD